MVMCCNSLSEGVTYGSKDFGIVQVRRLLGKFDSNYSEDRGYRICCRAGLLVVTGEVAIFAEIF